MANSPRRVSKRNQEDKGAGSSEAEEITDQEGCQGDRDLAWGRLEALGGKAERLCETKPKAGPGRDFAVTVSLGPGHRLQRAPASHAPRFQIRWALAQAGETSGSLGVWWGA